MKALNFLILFSVLIWISCKSDTLKCGEEEIENCSKCGEGDTCSVCKDKHFQFFNNLLCLPCNDPIYGDAGCIGNCDGSNYLNDRNIMCNENDCGEGLYNLNGICFNCTNGLPNCKKCHSEINEYNIKIYKCDECLSDEYKINAYGECSHCQINNCKRCHYNPIEPTL